MGMVSGRFPVFYVPWGMLFAHMRQVLVLVVLMISATVSAQVPQQAGIVHGGGQAAFPAHSPLRDSIGAKPWTWSPYGGFSTGFGYFHGGSGMVASIPVGLQLNRRLTPNLYAFAGVSVAPAYVNFNSSFLSANAHNFVPIPGAFPSNGLNLYSRAEMGLMYVNDQKTFSISGSIGIQRSNYSMYPGYPMVVPAQQPAATFIKH
jgi:hypothetical protein